MGSRFLGSTSRNSSGAPQHHVPRAKACLPRVISTRLCICVIWERHDFLARGAVIWHARHTRPAVCDHKNLSMSIWKRVSRFTRTYSSTSVSFPPLKLRQETLGGSGWPSLHTCGQKLSRAKPNHAQHCGTHDYNLTCPKFWTLSHNCAQVAIFEGDSHLCWLVRWRLKLWLRRVLADLSSSNSKKAQLATFWQECAERMNKSKLMHQLLWLEQSWKLQPVE